MLKLLSQVGFAGQVCRWSMVRVHTFGLFPTLPVEQNLLTTRLMDDLFGGTLFGKLVTNNSIQCVNNFVARY